MTMKSMQTVYRTRQLEIIKHIATRAYNQPLLPSGLWYHHDIRDNFYDAAYLFAAAVDPHIEVSIDRIQAKTLATDVLLAVLQLQDQDESSDTYGHWPLNLHPTPKEARPHNLPVELMGSLMIYFDAQYHERMSTELQTAFESAFLHIYQGNFYRQPMVSYGHHEAKFTAAKLILGRKFHDTELIQDGYHSLKLTLERVLTLGMWEYGSLPWFWHWVQVYTSAWELEQDADIRADLGTLLDYLWRERSLFYFKGTWAGPHARGLKHDVPRDGNVLMDYVQYGDFQLPEAMPRTEFAGFLFYEAPVDARATALDRSQPTEVMKRITRLETGQEQHLHAYAYITEQYAVGGMWERHVEFDNEQQRFDITFPLSDHRSINQAYLFHPGEGYTDGDPRHQSEFTNVLFHQNTIMALYPIPSESSVDYVVGVLPLGQWMQEPFALYGQIGPVYMAVHMMQRYQCEEAEDRYTLLSKGRANGAVMEIMDMNEAAALGIENLEQFAEVMRAKAPTYRTEPVLQVQYQTLRGNTLQLTATPDPKQTCINGEAIEFSRYSVTNSNL